MTVREEGDGERLPAGRTFIERAARDRAGEPKKARERCERARDGASGRGGCEGGELCCVRVVCVRGRESERERVAGKECEGRNDRELETALDGGNTECTET